jgi:hypothetical protein
MDPRDDEAWIDILGMHPFDNGEAPLVQVLVTRAKSRPPPYRRSRPARARV